MNVVQRKASFSQEALEPAGRPVVLLETAVITHGLRYPDNTRAAEEMAAAVVGSGAAPLFSGIIDGNLRIGLSPAELSLMARTSGVFKAGARDLPYCMARGLVAGTTVSATLAIAAMAGIDVVASGGIGGVHRDYSSTMDVSADLCELAARRAILVCSGAKSIMDLRRTLEYLETLGVPVVGYGVSEFPAFYSRTSGFPLDQRVDSPEEAAALYRALVRCGLDKSMLLCVPVPEGDGLDRAEVDAMVQQAIDQAASLQVVGKALTPILLTALEVLSGGRTVQANLSLLRNNAAVAGQVARALALSQLT